MRIFLLLLLGFLTLPVLAEPAGDAGDAAVSPWQGTWSGNENNSFGMNLPVKAKIKVTGETISGSWNVQSGGLNPITGTIKGEEASITILQGGGMIKATLLNEKTFKYSGIRGYGTLTKQEEAE
jgi:hypothetical protein